MESNILDSIDMRQIGKELQDARKHRGMTQEAAAEVLGVARTTITAIEKGERRIKAGELIKLARAYGRQVSDFVRQRPRIRVFPTPVSRPSFEPCVRRARRAGDCPLYRDTRGTLP